MRTAHLRKKQCAEHPVYSPCIFEYVYLARPDSQLDGISVYEARLRLGENLAKEIKKSIPLEDIDVVMPIPDSSRPAAAQLAKALNLPYREGFIKNRYVGPHLHHARPSCTKEERSPETERHGD